MQKRPEDKRPQPPVETLRPVPCDGGFYYSPVVWGGNKAGVADTVPPYFQSYASATADGLLALLAAGAGPHDQRVREALAWLKRHRDWTYSEGIPTDNPANWNLVLKFYHIAVRAEALAAMDVPKDEFDPAVSLLARLQQPDGRFFNPDGAPNKEDDPLLATALAISALHFILQP